MKHCLAIPTDCVLRPVSETREIRIIFETKKVAQEMYSWLRSRGILISETQGKDIRWRFKRIYNLKSKYKR